MEDVREKWGLVLTSTTNDLHRAWWEDPWAAPSSIRTSNDLWRELGGHLRWSRRTGGDFGALQINMWTTGGARVREVRRYLLWAFWPERVWR